MFWSFVANRFSSFSFDFSKWCSLSNSFLAMLIELLASASMLVLLDVVSFSFNRFGLWPVAAFLLSFLNFSSQISDDDEDDVNDKLLLFSWWCRLVASWWFDSSENSIMFSAANSASSMGLATSMFSNFHSFDLNTLFGPAWSSLVLYQASEWPVDSFE